MTLLLKQLFAFVKLLNSDTGHNQIAAGIACGLILGLTPAFSLQTLLVFLLAFVFRIQLGAAFLAAFFFKFSAYVFDPLLHDVGIKILKNPAWEPVFTKMYNLPIVPMTRFNNTIVMGAGVVAIVLAPVIFIVARFAILKYRHLIVARFEQTKVWKAVKATAFYKWYAKYEELHG